MTDYDLVRRCDVLEILDYEGFLGRTRKLVEQLVAVTPEAQAAEIERLRGDLAKAVAMLDKTRLVLAEWEPHPFPVLAQVRATLAELTGGKDE